jgi:hypothetical protein
MTALDAMHRLTAASTAAGVTVMFHQPFAWFGDRAAFHHLRDFFPRFSIGGDPDRPETSQLNVQPITALFVGEGWNIGYSGNILATCSVGSQSLARCLVPFVVLSPSWLSKELGRVLGEDTIRTLFFRGRAATASDLAR